MKRQPITESWILSNTDPGGAATRNPLGVAPASTTSRMPQGPWIPATVPGDVHADLLEAGMIRDPHYDTQAKEAYWITSKEWWYRTEFEYDDVHDSVDLCFEAVDGTADVYLNGGLLGTAENSFRPHRFTAGTSLRAGRNELAVRFRSIDELLDGPRTDELRGWGGRRAFLRKPQYNFGWDWALPLPSIGLAGGVGLETEADLRMVGFGVEPSVTGRFDFQCEVTREVTELGYEVVVRLEGPGCAESRRVASSSFITNLTIEFDDPVLWYPAGVGDQPVYSYEMDLVTHGRTVDRRSGTTGLRDVRVTERPFDAGHGEGYSFEIVVNDTPVFCKGSNWIPLSLWPATVGDGEYDYYLRRAAEAGFNMLRVWGGGVYERDRFYELCDELGIMVWQDFMFASTGYPVELLRDEITSEARYQLERLRRHPSIVLWCGCNEDVFSWRYPAPAGDGTGRGDGGPRPARQGDDSAFGEDRDPWELDRLRDDPQLYTMLLRGLVSRYGYGVPYVESSPQSRGDYGNLPTSGNSHISCWKYALFETDGHPERFRDHFERICSFDSEFCIQGPAGVDCIRSFLEPEHHWPPDEAWTFHIQRGHARLPHHEQTTAIASAIFGEIDSLESYVKHGQATHLEMTRAEYESARRDRPNNGGTMSWMFNDCWPTSNWSIIDYYRRPKPSFYAAKRACRPLLPIIFERAGLVSWFIDNQLTTAVECDIVYGLASVEGDETWRRTETLEIPANRCIVVDSVARRDQAFRRGDYLFVKLSDRRSHSDPGSSIDRSTECISWFPDGWRDIEWPDPMIEASVTRQEKASDQSAADDPADSYRYAVTLRTKSFARLCHLIWQLAPPETRYSDNYFDMCGGETRVIVVESPIRLDPTDLTVGHWRGSWG